MSQPDSRFKPKLLHDGESPHEPEKRNALTSTLPAGSNGRPQGGNSSSSVAMAHHADSALGTDKGTTAGMDSAVMAHGACCPPTKAPPRELIARRRYGTFEEFDVNGPDALSFFFSGVSNVKLFSC